MITLTGSNDYNQTTYYITSLSDVSLLPVKNVATGSKAIFPNLGNIKIYIFTSNDNNLNGTWSEVV